MDYDESLNFDDELSFDSDEDIQKYNQYNDQTDEQYSQYQDTSEDSYDSEVDDDEAVEVQSSDEAEVDDETADVPDDTGDPILITLIDKTVPGLLEYMRDRGLNTSVVTSDPDYIADIMMAQYSRCDILIMDTGSGLFATSEARKQILNIVQQCEGNLTAYFYYTDDAIKTDIEDSLSTGQALSQLVGKVTTGNKTNKQVTWTKYKTTPIVIAEMLTRCHTYRPDDYEYQSYDYSQPEELLEKHITLPTDYELDKQYNISGLTPDIVRQKVNETDEGLLVGFEPKFKVKMRL